ncbi:MAG: DUF2851 family protein [Bacteroidales bacterium]|nr:DUF2851 family protein [Bacteroidales bacterium]
MREDFLHFIWKFRLYSKDLETPGGESLVVVSPGRHNSDSGPDFSNAQVRIGTTLWAGNVEIHLRSSDWYLHHHHTDEAYSNVILHVVYENDKEIYDRNGNQLATLELKGKFNEKIFQKYYYYLNNKNWIPCEKDIHYLNIEKTRIWLDRLLVERMERKAGDLARMLEHNKNNFEETFYQVLAGNFGFKVNEQPFRILATMLPLQILGKHKDNLFQIEAMLFGTAGLLDRDFEDEYPSKLKKEYGFLQKKYALVPIQEHLWKFMRLRPSNFPTIRISQFAALIHKSTKLFSKIIETDNLKELVSFFDVSASAYWENHYVFDKSSSHSIKQLGKDAIHNILLNTVVQLLFLYSIVKDEEQFREKAMALLISIEPESNAITRGWESIGIKAANAFESQALIELKNNYCKLKKCLDCSIGLNLLKMNS